MQSRKPVRGRSALASIVGLAALVTAGLVTTLARRSAITFVVEGQHGRGHRGEWLTAPPMQPLVLRFSDGSRVELFAGTVASVVETDRQGAHVVLAHGRARIANARVVGGGTETGHAWRLSAGSFDVVTGGLKGEIDWGPDEGVFVLVLDQGRVDLFDPCAGSTPAALAPPTHVRRVCVQASHGATAPPTPR